MLNPEDGVELCLFVRDEAKKAVEDWLETSPVPGYVQVLGYKDLKSTYHDHKKRRELTQKYDAFVCDDSIIPMLTRLLGETFRRSKMEAGAVKVDPAKPSALRRALERARDSTYVRQLGAGSNTSVRIGTSAFSPDALADNAMAAVLPTVARIPGGWANVQQISLRAETTVALPLYCAVPELEEATGDGVGAGAGLAGEAYEHTADRAAALSVLGKLAPSKAKIQGSIGAFDRFPELEGALGTGGEEGGKQRAGAAATGASGASSSSSGGGGKARGKGKKRRRSEAAAEAAGRAELELAAGGKGKGEGSSGASSGPGGKGKKGGAGKGKKAQSPGTGGPKGRHALQAAAESLGAPPAKKRKS